MSRVHVLVHDARAPVVRKFRDSIARSSAHPASNLSPRSRIARQLRYLDAFVPRRLAPPVFFSSARRHCHQPLSSKRRFPQPRLGTITIAGVYSPLHSRGFLLLLSLHLISSFALYFNPFFSDSSSHPAHHLLPFLLIPSSPHNPPWASQRLPRPRPPATLKRSSKRVRETVNPMQQLKAPKNKVLPSLSLTHYRSPSRSRAQTQRATCRQHLLQRPQEERSLGAKAGRRPLPSQPSRGQKGTRTCCAPISATYLPISTHRFLLS